MLCFYPDYLFLYSLYGFLHSSFHVQMSSSYSSISMDAFLLPSRGGIVLDLLD